MREQDRYYSSKEKVAYQQRRIEECFCHFSTEGGDYRHGIIHKVYAARNSDAILALIASDAGVFYRKDIGEIRVH